MEHQDRFDLENALLAWRQDCASRPGISFEDARELEGDLRERVAGLLKEGLSEREAFANAVRQLGSPRELAREFARENPLAVWRERLFWIIAAGFGVEIWHYLTGGTIWWFHQTFGVLLPFSLPVWVTLAGQVPVLAFAVLLATGRLRRLPGTFVGLLESRCRLALAGLALILVGLLVRMFGPSPLQSRGSSFDPLLLLEVSLWPLILLALGVVLFRPVSAGATAGSGMSVGMAPVSVWRERVCWMAVGGILVGLWGSVSWLCLHALFFTGDINRPVAANPLLFMSVHFLLQLGPLIFLAFFVWQRMRVGKAIARATFLRKQTMFIVAPVMVIAWAGFYVWSNSLWLPRGWVWSEDSPLMNYLTHLRWLWPMGLAALIIWLTPRRPAADEREEIAE